MYVLVWLLCVCFVLDAKKPEEGLPVIPPYNLRSDERFTRYLPDRVRELTRIVKKDGIEKTCDEIRDDRDFESSLFILSVDEPVTLLAYSRQPEFFNKTASELQPLVFSEKTDKNSGPQVATIFAQLISTARKGDTYMPYEWHDPNNSHTQPQLAFVHMITVDEKSYVLGAMVPVNAVPDALVLSHRTKTLLARLKKNEFTQWVSLINNDSDPDLYFVVYRADYPYRWVAHGRNSSFINKSPAQVQKEMFGSCAGPDCDLSAIVKQFAKVAARGGGFLAHTYHARSEDPILLKFAYTLPFTYDKKKFFLALRYTPINFPDRLRTQLPEAVNHMISLISDIGFSNAISVAQKTNTPQLYVFVNEQEPPYKSFVQLERGVQTNAEEATKFAKKQRSGVDYQQLRAEMARFAQEEGGFFAYQYRAPKVGARLMLKVAYIKSVTVDDKDYTIGATYEKLN